MTFTGFSSDEEGSIVYDGEKFIVNNPEKVPENFNSGGKPVIYTRPPKPTQTSTPEPTPTSTPEPTQTSTPVYTSPHEYADRPITSEQYERNREEIRKGKRDRDKQQSAPQTSTPVYTSPHEFADAPVFTPETEELREKIRQQFQERKEQQALAEASHETFPFSDITGGRNVIGVIELARIQSSGSYGENYPPWMDRISRDVIATMRFATIGTIEEEEGDEELFKSNAEPALSNMATVNDAAITFATRDWAKTAGSGTGAISISSAVRVGRSLGIYGTAVALGSVGYYLSQGEEEEAFRVATSYVASAAAGAVASKAAAAAGFAVAGPIGAIVASVLVGAAVNWAFEQLSNLSDETENEFTEVPSHLEEYPSSREADNLMRDAHAQVYLYGDYATAKADVAQAITLSEQIAADLEMDREALHYIRKKIEEEWVAASREAKATGSHMEAELKRSYESTMNALDEAEWALDYRDEQNAERLSAAKVVHQDLETILNEAEAIYSD